MTAQASPTTTDALELSIVRVDSPDRTSEIYLLLSDGKPIVLGTGRFAEVWLASEGVDVANSRLLAVKLVRRDPESAVVTAVARWRFFEEMLKTSDKSLRTGIIDYFGFGTFRESYNWESLDASMNDINLQSEREFFSLPAYRSLVDELAKANRQVFTRSIGAEGADLQGEFYAMTAAHGTLEDLLLLPHDWQLHHIYRRGDTLYHKSLMQFRSDKAKQIRELAAACLPSAENVSRSGLAILKDLTEPGFRNRTILLLAHRLAKAVAALHSKQAKGQGYLAHRDLKLGNFLLVGGGLGQDLENLTVTLSDLGFVGGGESVAAARMTGKLSAREAFVLPPGTFPFRAPEQIQPVYEVTCVIDQVPPTSIIRLRTFADLELEVGDWIESPDLVFGDDQQPEKRARIEKVDPLGDGLPAGRVAECTLSCHVRYKKKMTEAKGSVIKATAQQSDLFSLGAIVYFIATGGRNPETFWSRCVSLAQSENSLPQTQGAAEGEHRSVFGSCVGFAVALCDDDGETFNEDLKHLQQSMGKNLREKEKGGWFSKQDKNIDFVRALTNNPSISPLLLDSTGRRMPLPIMLGILRCMLRGKPDSFVTPTDGERMRPMSTWLLKGKANECADLFANLTQFPSARFNRDPWVALGSDVDQLFFSLRIGIGESVLPPSSGL